MAVTDDDVNEFFENTQDAYGKNWSDYLKYKQQLQDKYGDERSSRYYTTIEQWQPIIWGAMLKQPLKEFFGHFDWQTEEYISPPCGEMPTEVMLVIYHAKRLEDVEMTNELPPDAMEQFQARRKELLYGSDPLSVLDYFEANL